MRVCLMIFAKNNYYSVLGRSGLRGIISVLLLALFGCTIPPVVESYRDPDLDYSVYKTFSFVSDNPEKKNRAEHEWSLEEKVLFPIVRSDMGRRGLSYQEEGADFTVTVRIANREKSEYVPQRTVYSTSDTYLLRTPDEQQGEHFFVFPVSQPVSYGGYTEYYFQIYAELNFFDSKTGKKIWKGSGLYRADTYDMKIAAPPLISAILERFRKLPKEKQ
jgi:hypothetical protein